MNKSVMKCCICNNENIGEFVTINDKKYHLCCIEQLQQTNQELKRNCNIGYENLNFYREENKSLKKQLEEANATLDTHCELIKYMENQQKKFIEYMNKTIEELECDDVGDEELKGYLIQRIDDFKQILSKYKEIIGVSNDY